MTEKIGVFGGTFAPFHNGHLQIVKYSLKLVDKLFIVPCGRPVHKAGTAMSAHHRIEVIKRMIEGVENVHIDDYELKSGKSNYTIELLRHYEKKMPEAQLCLIIGEDSYATFRMWYKHEQILEMCDVLVFPRSGGEIEPPFIKIDMPIVETSSTEVRKLLRCGESAIGHVNEAAERYLRKICGDIFDN